LKSSVYDPLEFIFE